MNSNAKIFSSRGLYKCQWLNIGLVWRDIAGNFRKFLSILFTVLFLSDGVACAQDGWRNARELFEAMQIKDGSWVADIGSREGYYTTRMSPLVGSGWIFAVDINANALNNLHANLRSSGIENVTPVYSVEDNPMLPFGTLDAVLIRNTYHEFTQPMSMLKYIRNALKSTGRVVVAEAISEDLKNATRQRQVRSHEIAESYVKDDLAKAGFRVIKEVDPFTESRRGRHFWMLIAIPETK